MPATELIIGAIAFLQALLLVLPRRRAVRAGGEILSVIGFSLAAAQLVWGLKAPSLPLQIGRAHV